MENFLDANLAAYDNLAKRVLSRKIILAHILKETVTEFADSSVEDIEKKYIEGDPHLSINQIPLDDTLDIKGKPTESKSPTEGIVTFDIIFDAIAPQNGEQIKIIVNIEAQKSTKTIDYPLMKRAVYYIARLISAQKEKEFHGDDYSGLKKVYSIWVCMNVQNYRADSIQEYGLTEKIIHGNFHDRQSNYDLIKIIILNLGKHETSHKLLNLLHLLFMNAKKTEEKEKILHDEYKIELTRNMKGELVKMGGLMEPLLEIAAEEAAEKAAKEATEKATAETKKATLLENIRNLMDSTKWTAKQAMDALKIPSDEQKKYLPLLA